MVVSLGFTGLIWQTGTLQWVFQPSPAWAVGLLWLETEPGFFDLFFLTLKLS